MGVASRTTSIVSTTFRLLRVILLSFLLAGQGYILVPAGFSHCDCVPVEQVCPCVQAHGACDCESESNVQPEASRSQTQRRPGKPAAWFCLTAGQRQKARSLQCQSEVQFCSTKHKGPIHHLASARWLDPLWRPPAWLRGPPSA